MIQNLIELNNYIERIDFNEDNSDKLIDLINKTVKSGTHPFFYFTIPQKAIIFRARKNSSENEPFWFPEELSFRRDVYNIKEFQRATKQNHTAFYGTFGLSANEEFCMETVLLETLPDINSFKGNYTISLWEINIGIRCFTIIDEYYKESNNKILNNVHKRYFEFLEKKPDLRNEIIRFNRIIANQFKKEIDRSNYQNSHLQYQVSGTIGSVLLEQNFGVVYPTAKKRNYSDSLNVALPWRFANSKLSLIKAFMFEVSVSNNKIHLNGINEGEIVNSFINNPDSDKNEDMLSGDIEIYWKKRNQLKYQKYF